MYFLTPISNHGNLDGKDLAPFLAVALGLKSHLALVLVGVYANKNELLVFCFILNDDELWNFSGTFQCLLSLCQLNRTLFFYPSVALAQLNLSRLENRGKNKLINNIC
uniref:Uncharacterized protein n=1 Tax=Micrurus spixii TaxID=129469 RepID=A0A2D4MUV4_9SAUR